MEDPFVSNSDIDSLNEGGGGGDSMMVLGAFLQSPSPFFNDELKKGGGFHVPDILAIRYQLRGAFHRDGVRSLRGLYRGEMGSHKIVKDFIALRILLILKGKGVVLFQKSNLSVR